MSGRRVGPALLEKHYGHSTGAGIRKPGIERTLATLFHKVQLRGITRVRSLWFGQRESEALKAHSCDFRDRASPL
jgi:hypothetical protein